MPYCMIGPRDRYPAIYCIAQKEIQCGVSSVPGGSTNHNKFSSILVSAEQLLFIDKHF